MRLFFALAASENMLISFANTMNAFQQSPPPTKQCYLEIDDAYASWYRKRFGIDLDRCTQVVPVNRALQGHPEVGVLWEKMIVGILEGKELNFKATTHERNLYRGEIDGAVVLVCRQVDDFAIASTSDTAAAQLIAVINRHAMTVDQGTGKRTVHGITARYNGVDIHQTRDHVKLSCENYIRRVLQTHGWESPWPRKVIAMTLCP